ncbi:MAG: GPR endopeptidase [Clostridiales bacterium]|jgi:spore protease|nr:GPR endopeptidase [Clostridiales bacterium]
MRKFSCRTDIASENRDIYRETNGNDAEGVEAQELRDGEVVVTRVRVTNAQGASALGKPIGNYITIDIPQNAPDRSKNIAECADIVKRELRELTKLIELQEGELVMVVGLGNWDITPDSLGPKVAQNVEVTRHLFSLVPEHLRDGIRPVCALTPGVLGTTGIETAEIIKGVAEHVKPRMLIAIDALASRKMQRVSSTIQLSDTGINPGAGIGNERNMISRETLGIPVVAIGVPTVVDAATLANDVLDLVGDGREQEERYNLIESVLTPTLMGNCFVTPKEIDMVIDDVAEIIYTGMNYALHRDDVWGSH